MITEDKVRELVESKLNESDLFLVNLTVSSNNNIKVEVDSQEGVSINDCAMVNRYLEGQFDREEEDFDIKVSSPGLDQPLRIVEQYEKNVGREVKVKTKEGDRLKGMIKEAGKDEFTLEAKVKKKVKGKKKKQEVTEDYKLPYDQVKETKVVISFK